MTTGLLRATRLALTATALVLVVGYELIWGGMHSVVQCLDQVGAGPIVTVRPGATPGNGCKGDAETGRR